MSEQRVPKVRTSHRRNAEEAARLQALVDKRYTHEAAPSNWQPIETAPKDEAVLVCGCGYRGYYVSDAKLIDGIWYLFDPLKDGYSADSDGHTHWMPLPAPPVEQAKTEVEG